MICTKIVSSAVLECEENVNTRARPPCHEWAMVRVVCVRVFLFHFGSVCGIFAPYRSSLVCVWVGRRRKEWEAGREMRARRGRGWECHVRHAICMSIFGKTHTHNELTISVAVVPVIFIAAILLFTQIPFFFIIISAIQCFFFWCQVFHRNRKQYETSKMCRWASEYRSNCEKKKHFLCVHWHGQWNSGCDARPQTSTSLMSSMAHSVPSLCVYLQCTNITRYIRTHKYRHTYYIPVSHVPIAWNIGLPCLNNKNPQ